VMQAQHGSLTTVTSISEALPAQSELDDQRCTPDILGVSVKL
jgi:hypothetical protein